MSYNGGQKSAPTQGLGGDWGKRKRVGEKREGEVQLNLGGKKKKRGRKFRADGGEEGHTKTMGVTKTQGGRYLEEHRMLYERGM